VPARSMTAFLGTACGNAMWAARVATRSALNRSGMATVQARSQSWQPVHAAGSTKVGLCTNSAVNVPSPAGVMRSTALETWTVTLGWWETAAIFGVEMQEAQSSVGKTLLRRIILPPTDGSFSTRATL